MRRLPLLLALVVGVALWAAPSQAQPTGEWHQIYIANTLAIPEGITAIPEFGGALCPFNSGIGCVGPSEAYHHIVPDTGDTLGGAVYATHVLDVSACSVIRVRVTEMDDDAVAAHMYLQSTLNDAGAGNLCANPRVANSAQSYILGDVNGDGIINLADQVPLDGDDGTDIGIVDGAELQTGALYDIVGENFVRLCIMRTGGDIANIATDSSYADIGCR